MLQHNWNLVLGVFFIIEWSIRLFMLFVVPKNRRPTSAMAWLMLIMLEPIVGTLLYLLIGTPKLPKHRIQLQNNSDAHLAQETANLKIDLNSEINVADSKLSKDVEKLVLLNKSLGGLPVFGGNKVDFLDDYQSSIDRLVADINNAKTRILFEYFIIVMDATSEPVLAALENAKKRGVEVYVLFDALACRHYPNFRKLKKRLSISGLEWKAMLPFSLKPGKKFTRPDLRNHRKIVVIDGSIGYMGSQNIVDYGYHRKDDLVYEELVARVEGPIVWQMSGIFRSDWYSETKQFLPADKLAKPVGKTIAQILPSGPGRGGSKNLKLYTSLIHAATNKIVIVTPYFVPDDSLTTALTSAAERGVDVTIINSEIIDKILVGHAQRSYYEEFLIAGVKIFLYKSPVFLHTKHITVDNDTAVIGSSNLDIRSFELDLEVSMLVYDKDSVQKLRSIESRYISNSNQLSYKTWLQRSTKLKMLDNLARLTAALQ